MLGRHFARFQRVVGLGRRMLSDVASDDPVGFKQVNPQEADRTARTRKVYTGERGINRVTLIGRVGMAPEMRGSEQRPMSIFSLATSQSFLKDDEYTQHTDWHRIIIFNPGLSKVVADLVKKGDKVYVQGSLRYSDYTPPGASSSVRTCSVLAEDVMIMAKPKAAWQGGTSMSSEEDSSDWRS